MASSINDRGVFFVIFPWPVTQPTLLPSLLHCCLLFNMRMHEEGEKTSGRLSPLLSKGGLGWCQQASF